LYHTRRVPYRSTPPSFDIAFPRCKAATTFRKRERQPKANLIESNNHSDAQSGRETKSLPGKRGKGRHLSVKVVNRWSLHRVFTRVRAYDKWIHGARPALTSDLSKSKSRAQLPGERTGPKERLWLLGRGYVSL